MAESKKRDCSSVSMKKKDALEDLDIGKDFFTSWSMADGDALDFDLTPASKGNKKPFDFDKADMDFNFDGDFGKISSFNIDMSDLDISPPFKKDGKSKERSKESSSGMDTGSCFNMDMSDLDISLPLKKDGKSQEKSKESSSGKHTLSSFNMDMLELDISPPLKKDGNSKEKSKVSSTGKDTGKTDRYAITFDVDELENFGFHSSLTKKDSKAQFDKNTKESSPDRSGCQEKDSSMHMNVINSMSTLEDGPQKPSLPETRITFNMDCPVGGSVDLEPTRKSCHSNSAMDDAVTAELSSEIDEVESDKAKILPEKAIVSMELRNSCQSIKLGSHGQVEIEACTGNDAMIELSFDYPSNNEPSGVNSSEAQNKVDSMHTNSVGSNGKQEANMISGVGSTSNTLSKNSTHLRTVAISENINTENSWNLVEDLVINDGGKTEFGQINSLVENPCTATAASGILCDSLSGRENQEPDSMIVKVPVVSYNECSQPAALSEKQTENGTEHLVNCSLPSIRPEKPGCSLLKVSTQTTFSSFSSKKMGFAQPSLVEGRDGNTSQSDKKLISLSLQHSKTLLRGELPQIRSQENCNGVKICREMGSADRLQNGKKIKGSFETQIKDMVKTKPAMRQREMSMKDLDTLSVDINKKAAKDSENPRTSTSVPTMKKTPLVEHRLSSTEGGRKTPELPRLKLTGLSLDSTNSPIQKDSKSVRKTPSDVAHFLDTQKQTPSTLCMKRALEDAAASSIALHPSKRLSQSANTSRNLVETPEKFLNRKVACHNHMEDDRVISATGNCQVMAIHLPHDAKNKVVEISFSIQNDSIVKMADAYTKKLDDLGDILRKKHDEAKGILVRAIVNSNKLLMLNNPKFDEKIRATQDMFARLTLNSVHG